MKILRILLLILILSPFGSFAGSNDSIAQGKISDVRVFPLKSFRAVYKTKIDYKDKHFSGLLLVRENQDSSFRIAFVTEVGMKIFEFEFFPRKKDNFKLVSILPYLDKGIIINVLRRDFESVFMTFAKYKKAKIKDLGEGLFQKKYCYQGKRIYRIQAFDRIIKMQRKKFFSVKEKISFEYDNQDFPAQITIHHLNAQLNMEMQLIKFSFL